MSAAVDLRYVLDRTDPGGALPVEDEARLASVPDDIPDKGAAAADISDHMLPLFVRSAEKRALRYRQRRTEAPTELPGLLRRRVPQWL